MNEENKIDASSENAILRVNTNVGDEGGYLDDPALISDSTSDLSWKNLKWIGKLMDG